MKRTKIEEPVTAILTADWHLRLTTPVCRTDDYEKAQWKKVKFVKDLQKQHNCPVLHAGDLFDYWKATPELLTKTVEYLPSDFHTVYGNHDLPQHNIEQAYKSGVTTLIKTGWVKGFDQGYWLGQMAEMELGGKKIGIIHEFTYKGGSPWPGCTARPAGEILEDHQEFDLILIGDNHKSFVIEDNGRLLVNPGSIMRMDADQLEHEPVVYLWYASTNTVKKVYLPAQEGVISREHLEKKHNRDERLTAFVTRLNSDWEVGVSFQENLKRFLNANKIRNSVVNIIQKAVENG